MPRVFISYVRDNAAEAGRLAAELRGYGVDTWINREQLKPGERWGDAIRQGIASGDYFIACFSQEYVARNATYMNEELTLAIEQLRLRRTDRAWFIPVLLSPCEVPTRSIGAGETLQAIQHVALYEDWHGGIRQIARTILPIEPWKPYEIVGPHETVFVLLPLGPYRGLYAAMAKYPVTNEQYRRMLRARANRPVRRLSWPDSALVTIDADQAR
jgi:hypothetical protein